MLRGFLFRPAVFIGAFLALPGMAGAADIMVERAWARANVGGAGAAYLTIVNRGEAADRLISAKTPVAMKASLHTHLMVGNVARMRPVKDIEIPSGKTIRLMPGGIHIMLMGVEKRLVKGEKFPLTLTFEKGGALTVNVAVLGIAAMGPSGHSRMKHGKH